MEEDKRSRKLIERSPKFQRTKAVIKTWYRQGIEDGFVKGQQKMLLAMLSKRFPNKITAKIRNQVKRMGSDELGQLVDKLVEPSQTLESLGLVNGVVSH